MFTVEFPYDIGTFVQVDEIQLVKSQVDESL